MYVAAALNEMGGSGRGALTQIMLIIRAGITRHLVLLLLLLLLLLLVVIVLLLFLVVVSIT